MTTAVVHRESCRLCLSRNVELAVKLDPIPLAEKYTATKDAKGVDDGFYPIDLYMCRDCAHVQVLDVIDSDTLWDDYTYHSGQTKGIVDHFEQVADALIERFQPAPGGLVIDVGSNDGSLLRPFKDRGFRVLGIDPAKAIARKATESGIPTIASLLTPELAATIREEHGPAAVITAFNVFAHADDMNGMADSIRSMLAPDGIFQFEAQYLLDIIDKLLLGTVFHEHMSHHSLKPMKTFLERHGMVLVDVERVTIQMGSIIGSVQPKGGTRPVQPAVGELLALEEKRGLDKVETVRGFSTRLGAIKNTFATLTAEWKRQGKSVAAYGAARSGPTFIVQFGLDQAIEFLMDDHPQKVGKFSPGHRLPVVPTSELMARKPDYVIILAWIHAKKIIASNRAYLEQGGHFVLCTPEVQVIDASSPLSS